jgi:hypothetical protein
MTTLPARLHPRAVSTALAVLVAALLFVPSVAQAQFWNQEAEIIVPNQPNSLVRAFIDSLGAEFDRTPGALVQRVPGGDSVAYLDLSDALLEEGVDIRSASHLFVSYTFLHTATGLIESIRSVTLIYRPLSPTLDEPDLALLHLKGDNEQLQTVLRTSGRRNPANLGAITPFRESLAYPKLSQIDESHLVRFAGEELREGFDLQRDHLLSLLTEFIYNEGESFVMRLE